MDGRSTWPVRIRRRPPATGSAAFRSTSSRIRTFAPSPNPCEYENLHIQTISDIFSIHYRVW